MALGDEDIILIKFQNPYAQDYIFNYLHVHINQYFEILIQGCYYYGQLLYLLFTGFIRKAGGKSSFPPTLHRGTKLPSCAVRH